MTMTMTKGSSSVDSALNNLAGVVILAGGASRRMGTPKATLTLPTGETLLDYHVRHSLTLNVPVMIADNERGFDVDSMLISNNSQSPVIHIADYDSTNFEASDFKINQSDGQCKSGGALVAIESALQTLTEIIHSDISENQHPLSSAWLLVISCDSLIPATDLWQKLQPLTTKTADKKVICLADDEHLYPLLGIYQLSVELDLKAYIDSGERKVMSFIKPVVQPVSFVKNWQHLTNFNTPTDFARACQALNDL